MILIKIKNLFFYNIIYLSYQFLFKNNEFREILADYKETKKNLKNNIYPKQENKTIALIAFNGVLINTKLEILLLLPYIQNGYNVLVLLRDEGNPWTKIYLKLLKNIKFINISKFKTSKTSKLDIKNKISILIKDEIKFHLIKNWSYLDVLIGPTILSNIQRRNRLGSPNLKDPLVVKNIYHLLPIIMSWVEKIRLLFDNFPIEKIITIEANDWNSPIISLAIKREIDCIQVVQPFKDDSFIFKRLNKDTIGTNPNSIDKSTLNKIKKIKWTDSYEKCLSKEILDRYSGKSKMQSRNHSKTKRFNKCEILKKLNLDSNKKIACVFSHILWDANLFYGSDLYSDYSEWFIETLKIAIENPDINWIIKLHPANIWKRQFEGETSELAELSLLKSNGIDSLPKHIALLPPESNIDTYSLFNIIDYGITVRGTVGIELPCFGKWVITAGTGRYTDLGITKDPKSIQEYEWLLRNLNNIEIFDSAKIQLAKWHAYLIFVDRPCKFEGLQSI